MKRFVKAMVSKLDVSNAATHVAAIAYSNNPEVVWRFRNFQGTDDVNRVIDRMPWQRGFTYTDKALLLADRDLFQTFNGMRLNVPKVSSPLVVDKWRFQWNLPLLFSFNRDRHIHSSLQTWQAYVCRNAPDNYSRRPHKINCIGSYALVIGFPEGRGPRAGMGILLIVHFKDLVFPHRWGIFFLAAKSPVFKGRASRFSACASDDLSAVKIIVFRPIRSAFTTPAGCDSKLLYRVMKWQAMQARLPLVVEVIPAFKRELAHVQS